MLTVLAVRHRDPGTPRGGDRSDAGAIGEETGPSFPVPVSIWPALSRGVGLDGLRDPPSNAVILRGNASCKLRASQRRQYEAKPTSRATSLQFSTLTIQTKSPLLQNIEDEDLSFHFKELYLASGTHVWHFKKPRVLFLFLFWVPKGPGADTIF